MSLLAGVIGLQLCFTLLVVTLRPYISAVLNAAELATSCLEVAFLLLAAATYHHTRGDPALDDVHTQVTLVLHPADALARLPAQLAFLLAPSQGPRHACPSC